MFLSNLLFWTMTLYLRCEHDWQSASAQESAEAAWISPNLHADGMATEKKELGLRSNGHCGKRAFSDISNAAELTSAE
jgi:hypothetical protein